MVYAVLAERSALLCMGMGLHIPMLRTTHIKLTFRTAMERAATPLTNSWRYDIGCVIPIPPAMSITVPYEERECRPPATG